MTATARQLPLDLGARPALGRDDFFLADPNAAAVAAIDAPGAWAEGRLVLSGPEGAGKTHLAHVFAAATGAPIRPAAGLGGADIAALGALPHLVLEDADRARAPADEEALFHLLNLLGPAGGRLLLTARSGPPRWGVGLPDLLSRLQAASLARLDPPDDALLRAVLMKHFADRQIAPSPETLAWLAARIDRSFAAAAAAVARLDAAALAAGRPVTRALARETLGEAS